MEKVRNLKLWASRVYAVDPLLWNYILRVEVVMKFPYMSEIKREDGC